MIVAGLQDTPCISRSTVLNFFDYLLLTSCFPDIFRSVSSKKALTVDLFTITNNPVIDLFVYQ